MSARKATVEHYIEGFRRSDHEAILFCLTDEVRWDMPGFFHLLFEDGDAVVAVGAATAPTRSTGSRPSR